MRGSRCAWAFFPSWKIKAGGHLAQLACACVSKGITCWGSFTNDLGTEIAGRSLKDFTSGRSLNQTLRVGCWTNPSPAAPASTSTVLGLAYPRMEQLSQHIKKITSVEENSCRLQGFWVFTAVMCVPFCHSCLIFGFGFCVQSRDGSGYSSEMSKQRDMCLVYFTGEAHYNRKCHGKIDWVVE